MPGESMPAEPLEPPPAVTARLNTRPTPALASPIAVAILCLIVFAIYLPGIGIPYFGDDVGWIDTSTNALSHFVQVNADGWYRPLQASIYTVLQKNFGLTTVPIHVLCFLIHALLCWLILKFMLELGYGWVSASLAASFMALSQANAFALLSNDTLSQVAGTFFGCLSLWALVHSRAPGRNASRIGFYAISVLSFALALLSKETTASFFPILVCAILFAEYRRGHIGSWIKSVFLNTTPFAVVFLGYLLVRFAIGANSPSFGSGNYNFDVGLNVPWNLLLDLFALAVPISTVRAFEAFTGGETTAAVLIIVSSVLFLSLVAYGLWLRRHDLKIAAAMIFLIGSAFPMVFMNHVSELYVYNSMPFFSVLVGIGIGTVLEHCRRQYVKQMIAVCFGLVLLSHVAAIREKAVLMEENGQRASRLLAALGPYIAQVPRSGALLLVNPANRGLEYAVYLMPGFKVLEFEETFIKKTYGREDIDLEIVEEADLALRKMTPGTMILGLKDDTLSVFSKP
jgi:hypothetical protein